MQNKNAKSECNACNMMPITSCVASKLADTTCRIHAINKSVQCTHLQLYCAVAPGLIMRHA